MLKAIIKNGLGIPSRNKFAILGKAIEELGEVATILNKPSKEHPEPLQAEVIDVINAVGDLAWIDWLEKMGINPDDLKADNYEELANDFVKEMHGHQEVKLAKWTSNYIKWCRANDETETHIRKYTK